MNNLWKLRELSFQTLATEFRVEAKIISRSFSLVDKTIARFEEAWEHARDTDKPFFYFCGCTLAKGYRLCLGDYSLGLDGLSWEAGALRRTLLEVIERLHWLKNDPSRARKLDVDRSNRTGKIARSTGSPFQDARSHLSETASHFVLSTEVVNLLTDSATGHLLVVPKFDRTQLHKTLSRLFVDLLQLLIVAINCLAAGSEPNHDLADELEHLREAGFRTFKIVAIAGFGIPQDIPQHEQANYKYPLEIPILRFPPLPDNDKTEDEQKV